MEALIYNYSPKYTGAVGSSFVQQYLFDEQEVRRNDGSNKTAATLWTLLGILALHRFWL